MADIAGLVVGIISVWGACVQVFDIVDSGRNYGAEYEKLRAKLEFERIRLLHWGMAMGLSGVGHGPDARLNREDVCRTVTCHLSYIQHIFEHSAKLQETYGLCASNEPDGGGGLAQQPLILDLVFKRAYENLSRLVEDRQRATSLGRKAIWAIRDKKKFEEMVLEIKWLNDNLENLFPGAKQKILDLISMDISESEAVQGLQLVKEATEGEHEDISDTASIRLGILGATLRPASYFGKQTISGNKEASGYPWACQALQPRGDSADRGAPSGGSGTGMDELFKEMKSVDLYIGNKREGALRLRLSGPHSYSTRVVAFVDWEGRQRNEKSALSTLNEGKGFVKTSHASFDLYRRKRFIGGSRAGGDTMHNAENDMLFDIESDPKYENTNPGTITVEGFAMECWDYEENSRREGKFIRVNDAKIPNIPARKLLRRIDELRRSNPRLRWDTWREDDDLQEFVENMGYSRYVNTSLWRSSDCASSIQQNPSAGNHSGGLLLGDICSLLNRRDVFADFTSNSSIAPEFTGFGKEITGLWSFLWQVIIATELARRFERYPDWGSRGFTPKILASLIVADLWLRNVEIIMRDNTISLVDIKKPQTPLEEAKAEDFKSRGNKAMKNKQYQEAVDLYTKAVKIDLSSAVYRANRSAALLSMEKFEQACTDAFIATQLDPNYAKAWARLGIAHLKRDNWQRAHDAYQRAIEVAGDESTSLMRQGLAGAKAKLDAEAEAIDRETNPRAREVLRKNCLDQDWDTIHKIPSFHSRVHEWQVEGLLIFAGRMKWPYINEARNFAEGVYTSMRGGQAIPCQLLDWLFGITLPGKWMSYKIMTALIICTPSIAAEAAITCNYQRGLSLPQRTYWRVRTVLGRVLGCLPGVISLCGWIGPCPPVEFVPAQAESKPRHILLKARPIELIERTPRSGNGVIYSRVPYREHEATRIQPDEEPQPYLAEIRDHDRWVVPEPPVREVGTCSIQAIRLQKLPLDVNLAARSESGKLSDKEVDLETQYRARIVFKMDNSEDPITYTLYTNPVFVTLPPCHSGLAGRHEVHLREIPRYQKNIWTVERLKDHTAEESDDVMVINATRKGTEVLARAWCSERGKNAVIRRSGGPCYACAIRAAGKAGLDVATLIWVS